MRILDSKYFKLVEKTYNGENVYEAYECKFPGSTIILVGRDDPTRPIAALSFLPLSVLQYGETCDTISAIAARESTPQRFRDWNPGCQLHL